jgi:hypothetical protein
MFIFRLTFDGRVWPPQTLATLSSKVVPFIGQLNSEVDTPPVKRRR